MADLGVLKGLTLGQILEFAAPLAAGLADRKPEQWVPEPGTTVPKATTGHSRFRLKRRVDHSGVSGTGYVADGVRFPDGTVVVRWTGDKTSTSIWKDVATLLSVHGHEGDTIVEWID